MFKRIIAFIVFFLCCNAFAAELSQLIRQCSPKIHHLTMTAIVKHESNGNWLAIGDNGTRYNRTFRSFYPVTKIEAIELANNLIKNGHIIDIGLGQINNRNLPRLGVTIEEAFDPCINLQLAERILLENYELAAKTHGHGQRALREALSRYNTGDPFRGFRNGYVRKVIAASKAKKPVIHQGGKNFVSVSRKPKNPGVFRVKLPNNQKKSRYEQLLEARNASGIVHDWKNL